ncbi:unnamed protein product [Spirodela intermedia]|uniref:BHLH domain-containing protein n=2 Tax=Spirodela intermedia TaxID=51605 RepID=A0A7I8IE01_SPIIN|nr:unnamed protein product [Spirodela intermedia]CAA6656006.1 unnamed protein product [Spirodela intermedia]CAA7391436.1 unnamed protein product [Spirodela intermedia]
MKTQVPEDQRTIEFIVSQFVGQSPPTTFAADCQLHRDLDGYVGIPDEHPTWGIQPVPSCDHHSFPWDPPSDQSRLCVSPLNLFEGHREDDAFFEGSSDSVHSDKRDFPFDPLPGFHQPAGRAAAQVAYTSFGNSTVSRELGCHDKESIKQEGEGRTDSFLDGSDQMGGDDDDEQKTGRSDRRPSCKNLMAERKRRKKLNDRLYDLRSLVPKISKMDKASILGDAIEFVKDLQNQVKKLQDQLEETTPVDDGAEFDAEDVPHLNNKNNDNHDIQPIDNKKRTGTASPRSSSMIMSSTTSKDPRRSPIIEKKENQMEPQVEVSQVGANKFFLKVFCEHRRGGFVRLMEAMASLGFDVINVNVTTSEPLVLNVFEVEVRRGASHLCPLRVQKRDSEVVQADQVRSSLLRLAMDSDDSCLQL